MKRASAILLMLFSFLVSQGGNARDPYGWKKEFEKREGTSWRYYSSANENVRAIYGLGTRRQIKEESAAFQFLADYFEMFGIKDTSQLHAIRVEKDASGASYLYRQFFAGVPVVGSEFAVHTDSFGHVISAGGQFYDFSRGIQGNLLNFEVCRRTAGRFRFADGGVSKGELMILPMNGVPRPAWKFEVSSNRKPERSYLLYVDAIRPQYVLRIHRTYAEFDGTGTVFMENPVVTPELSVQPFSNLDDSTSLSGNFVKTYNSNFTQAFLGISTLPNFTTAANASRTYNYMITDPEFTEAMAYFHVNRVHDRWRSLGFNKLNVQLPVLVNLVASSGAGIDNAFYRRGSSFSFRNGAILVGAGRVFENLGHDSDVYYHEYGHAVLDHAKPGFFEAIETNYPAAFHEAFSDISAVAINGNPKLGEFALRSRATKKFMGRNLDNRNRFPQNVILKPFGKSEPHYTGLIVGGSWWDLQKVIGIPVAQNIIYRSLPFMSNEMTFFELRDSMLAADRRFNHGSNSSAIQEAFAKHGLEGEDPGQKGTVTLQSLKTALFKDDFTFSLRSKFKRGDIIAVLISYAGSRLTPGYNLIGENIELTGPKDANVFAYFILDEAVNGSHTGAKGAWIVEVDTDKDFSKPGTYTVSAQCRLGGTSQRSEAQSVTFRLN
jgi:Zn-dependent metalloprotease